MILPILHRFFASGWIISRGTSLFYATIEMIQAGAKGQAGWVESLLGTS